MIPERLEREMGYTPAEFMATLPRALHGYDVALRTDGADIYLDGQRIQSRIGAEQERRIALIRLPYIHVLIDFAELSAPQRTRLLHQFDLYFKKGGG